MKISDVVACSLQKLWYVVKLAVRDVGSLTGSVVLFPIAGLICEYGLDGKGFDGGWPSIFYIFGKLVICTTNLSDVVMLGIAYDGVGTSPVDLQNLMTCCKWR